MHRDVRAAKARRVGLSIPRPRGIPPRGNLGGFFFSFRTDPMRGFAMTTSFMERTTSRMQV